MNANSFTKFYWALALSLLISGFTTVAVAQTPFTCTDGVSYRIQGNPSALYTVNLRTGAATLLFSAANLGNRNLQALGYNSLDNFLYASVSGTNTIVRIASDGTVTQINVPNLPAAAYTAGDVGPAGNLYLYVPNATTIQRVNLSTLAVTAIPLTTGANLPDLVISPDGNSIYGIDATSGSLVRYATAGGAATTTPVGFTAAITTSAYIDNTGDLFVVDNANSDVYEVPGPSFPNASSGTRVAVQTAAITNTDGARCILSAATTQTAFACQAGQAFNSTVSQGYNNGDCSLTAQGKSTLIEYNLGTGTIVNTSGQLIDDFNARTSINNLGYNQKDNYLWAYRVGTNQIVRIDQNRNVDYFAIPGLVASCGTGAIPQNDSFFSGDINSNGVFYLLNGIDGDRFIRIDLNPTSPTYLQKLSDLVLTPTNNTPATNLPNIADIAFNPVDGNLYTITATNQLVRVDPAGGVITVLGTVSGIGTSGTTYVADFFDVNGALYIKGTAAPIYRIPNVAAGNLVGSQFATGPVTAGGDGARCPLSAVQTVTLSGRVLQDANGLTDGIVNGNAVSSLAGNTFYANLIGPTGTVVASTGLTSGTFSFTGVGQNTSYSVVLSNTPATVGSAPPSTTLTGGVVNIGENIGTAAGSDGTPNGVISVSVGTTNATNVDFGVEQRPVGIAATDSPRPNPGGNLTSPVSATVFTGTDPEDGTYPNNLTGRTVTLDPGTNGTLFYNGSPVTSTTAITNFNPALVSIDPTAPGATTGANPSFTYSVNDNAGIASLPQTITVPFTASLVSISGSVLNDVNGLTDNTVNGPVVNNLAGNTFYANLVGPSGTVVASNVLTNGTYSFSGLTANTAYSVVLTNAPGTVGAAPASTSLTGGVVNTGETIGTGPGSDGTPNGVISVSLGTASVTNANFGVEQRPVGAVATDVTRPNPGGTLTSAVSSTVFTGTDPEDGTYPNNLTGRTVTLSPATNGILYYNGSPITSTTAVTNFNPALVSIDPTAPGATTGADPSFTYSVNDNADIPSLPQTITVPFSASLVSISGSVLDDANGLTDNTVNGTAVSDLGGNTFFANLVGPAGAVIASTALTNGTYSFNGLNANTTYSIILSTSLGTVGSAPPSMSLINGVVNTGETIGTGPGSDGTPNGVISVSLGIASVTDVNFGIEQRPVGVAATDSPRPNPGGNLTSPVSATVFTGTDPEDGTYPNNLTGRTVTLSAGTNGTLFYNGSPVTSTTAITNFNPALVSIDPTAPGATTGADPSFTYSVTDNAGVASLPQTITVPFSASLVSISGSVLDDANGLTDNTVNGTAVNGLSINTFFVSLVGPTGTVVASTSLTNGTYSFSGLTGNTAYSVVLGPGPGTVGSAPPTTNLSGGVVNTGETIGTAPGSDGTPDGVLAVSLSTGSVTNANFGVEQQPVGLAATDSPRANPGGNLTSPVSATVFTGTDPEDGTYPNNLTGRTVTLSPASDGTLYYNGSPVTSTTAIVNFNPALVSIDPTAPGATTGADPRFTYSVTDNAGVPGLPQTITVPFTASLVSISGSVFNDVNGLTDNTINGTAVSSLGGNTLYANLVGPAGTVVASTVLTNGTYSFSGLTANTAYSVVLTSAPAAVGAAPASTSLTGGVVNTGETIGTAPGSDGTPNGVLSVSLGTGSVSNANFGIEQLPTPGSGTASVVNTGGTTPVVVPPGSFTNTSPSSDPAPGTVVSIRIPSFPTNTTSLTINGTVYTPASFPAGGVVVPTDGTGTPTVPILVDPTDDTQPVSIPIRAIDDAGLPSATIGTVVLNSVPVFTISGNVFNDVNALTDNTVNGAGVDGPGLGVYVSLVQSGTLVATVPVSPGGAYSFSAVPNGSYSLVVTTSPTGSLTADAPVSFTSTGETIGTGPGSDGTSDGVLSVSVTGAAVSDANFGIEQPPTAGSGASTVANNGGTSPVVVPPGSFTNTAPSSDPAPGTVVSIRIPSFPTNTTSLTINGTVYTPASFPAGGVVVPTDGTGTPTVPILVDPTDDTQPVSIPIRAIDNGGVESANTGTAVISTTPLFVLSGSVFDDANGLTDNTVNGAGVDGPSLPLYVSLVQSGTLVATVPVSSTGGYVFSGLPAGSYTVVLTTSPTGSLTASVPGSYTSTGETIGTAPGSDGTPDGVISVTIGASSLTAVNFGIEQLPSPGSGTATVANNGGTTPVVVPPGSFTNTSPSTDPAPGTVASIRIPTFPTNATSLTINGTVYTPVNFPAGGVVVPTDGTGSPTVPILLDPTDDGQPVSIPIRAIDNAGVESTSLGTAVISPAPCVLPAITLASSSNTACIGSGLVTLTATVTPAGSYTYTFAGPNGFVDTNTSGTSSFTATSVAQSGSYTVTVSSSPTCSTTAAVSVSVQSCTVCQAPVLTVSTPICNSLGTGYTVTIANSVGSVLSASGGILLDNMLTVNGNGDVTITATNSCSAASSLTVQGPALCPTPACTTPPVLFVGQPVCLGNGQYQVSFTSQNGAVTTSAGTISGNTITAPIGTSLVVSIAGTATACGSFSIAVDSPVSCSVSTTDCGGSPLVSVSGPACSGNGFYAVNVTVPVGNTVVTSTGQTLTASGSVSAVVGTNMILTASNSTCPPQSVSISSPTTCPVCQPPVLTVSTPVCSTVAGGLYTVSYVSSTTNVTVSGGTLLGNTITALSNTGNILVTANGATGCATATSLSVVAPAACPASVSACPASPVLTVGQPVCVGNGQYQVSFTSQNGAVSTSAGTISGNTITAPIGSSLVVSIAGTTTACGSYSVAVGSPVDCSSSSVSACSGSPLVSVSGPACSSNGFYTVNVTVPVGNTVVTSMGQTLTASGSLSAAVGTAMSLTASNGTCPPQSVSIASPTTCPACQPPVLTVSTPVCSTVAGGLYTVSYVSSTTNVTVSGGTLLGNTITALSNTGNIVVTANDVTGCATATSLSVVAPAACPASVSACPASPVLTVGQPVCVGNGQYQVSFTSQNGTVSSSAGTISGNTITAPIGSSLVVSIAGSTSACGSYSVAVGSPVDCSSSSVSACSGSPLVSVSGPACSSNGFYTVNVTVPVGNTVVTSMGQTLTASGSLSAAVGTAMSLTASNGTCPPQSVSISSPTSCPACQAPVLTLTGPFCETATGTYRVNYIVSQGASITLSAGTLNAANQTITNVPPGLNLVVTAISPCGKARSLTMVAPASCIPTAACPALPTISIGDALCDIDPNYVASVEASDGATLTAFGGTVSDGLVTGTLGSNVTVVASTGAGCSVSAIVSSPVCDVLCSQALISISSVGCQGNGLYSVNFVGASDAIITANAGIVDQAAGTITSIPLGTVLSLTASNGGVCPDQIETIQPPASCPACQPPVLTVSTPVCSTVAGGLYTVSYVSSTTNVTVSGGTLLGNTITALSNTGNIVVTANDVTGCATATSLSVVAPAACPASVSACPASPVLTVGQPVCVGNGQYQVSFTSQNGAVSTSAGTISVNTITAPIGSSLVVSIAGTTTACGSYSVAVGSPVDCSTSSVSACTGSPLVSVSGPSCSSNGFYTVNVTVPVGNTVVTSMGQTLTASGSLSAAVGTAMSLTASNGTCPPQSVSIASPTTCPACQPPVLTVSTPVCSTVAGGLYTVNYVSSTTNVTVSGGTISGSTITALSNTGTIVVTANDVTGCATATSLSVVAPAACPASVSACPASPVLTVGQPVCVGNGQYQVSFTSQNGAVSTSAGTISGNTITAPMGSSLVVSIAGSTLACGSYSVAVGSPVDCSTSSVSACTGSPLVSVSGPACSSNGFYTVNVTVPVGNTVTSSTGQTLTASGSLSAAVGTAMSLTASNGSCPPQSVSIASPTTCPLCQPPVLTAGSPVCNTATSQYTFTLTNSVGSVLSAVGGSLSGNVITATAGSDVVVTATSSTPGCSDATSLTVLSPVCPTTACVASASLTVGAPVCIGNGQYAISFTAQNGTISSSAGTISGNVITAPVGTNLVVSLTGTSGCGSQGVAVTAPNCNVTACTGSPLVSLGGTVCNGNGFYTINFVPGSGVTITASAGTVGAGVVSNIPVGTPVSLTAVSANGCPPQVVNVVSPVCPACQPPLLTVSTPVCSSVSGGLYRVNFSSSAANVTATGGTILNNMITALSNTGNIVVTAQGAVGCANSSLTVVAPASCPISQSLCPARPVLSVGQPVCLGTGQYVVSVNSQNGTVTTSTAGAVLSGNTITAPVGTSFVVSIAGSTSACGSYSVAVGSPVSCPASATDCSGSPLASIAGPVCSATGFYTVNVTVPAGVTVSNGSTALTATGSFTTAVGTAMSLTASNGTCPPQSLSFASPTDCPVVCQAPVLTLTGPFCETATGTYRVNFVTSQGATISLSAGTLNLANQTITGVPVGTDLVVTATAACGKVRSLTLLSPTTCTPTASCTALPTISVGDALCDIDPNYVAAVEASEGAILTAIGGVVSDGLVTGTLGSNVTVVASTGAGCSVSAIISPPVCDVLCSQALISISSVGCQGNGLYSVNFVPVTGAIITANAGIVDQTAGTISSIPLGTVLSLTASNGGVCPDQIETIQPPTTCPAPLCVTPLGINIVVTTPSCGSANGQITATVLSGATPFSYRYSNGATTQTITGLTAGTYSVTVTDANGCIGIRDMLNLPNSSGPAVSLLSVSPATCGQATGAASVSVSGGTAPYTYQFSNGASTSSVSGLNAGTYTVSVQDANGCTSILTVVVPGTSSLSLTASATNASCGAANGTASVVVSGGTAPYSYSYSNGATTASVSGLIANIYSVTVSDASGCTAVATVNVNNISGPSLTVNATNVACNGSNTGTATAIVSGGTAPYRYAWSNGASTSSVSGLTAGTYTVSVQDANGCVTNGQVTITQPAPIIAIYSPSQIVCPSTVANINQVSISGGAAPYSYSWSSGQTTANLTGVVAGSYTVVITDANGCVAFGSVVIDPANCPVNPCLSPLGVNVVVTTPSCGSANGQITATVLGGVAPYTYRWSNGSTSPTIQGLTAGTYSVTVTDANGCTGVRSMINLPNSSGPALSLVNVSPASCGQATGAASVSVSGGTAPYTYQWTNGATTSSVSGLAAGQYTVNASDANGCTSILTVVVPGSSSLSLTASATNASCGAVNGTASVAVTGGTAPYTYRFSNGATSASLSALASGIYSVTVTDAASCSAVATVNVNNISGPSLTVNSTNVTCNGSSTGTATAVVSGGTAPYTYAWSNGVGSTSSVSGLTAGTYTVVVRDASGCQASQQVTISQPTPIIAIYSPTQIVCPATVANINQVSISGGTAPYSYSWSSGQTTASLTGVVAGSYSVVITDANGCVAFGAAVIAPVSCTTCQTPTLTLTNPVCNTAGSSYTVSYSVSNGATLVVSAGVVNTATQTISGIPAGTNLTVTASATCGAVTSSSIAAPTCVQPCPVPTLSLSTPVCNTAGTAYTLTVTNSTGSAVSVLPMSATLVGSTISAPSGTNLTVTAASTTPGCTTVTTVRTVVAPNCPQPCPGTLLVASTPQCNTATGTYSVNYIAAPGITVTANAGNTSSVGVISGVPAGVILSVTATNGACSQTLTINPPAGCSPPISNTCVTMELKVLLEGPYNTTTHLMNTTLNQRGLLPGQSPIGMFAVSTPAGQPYNTAPWNYTGTESVTTYPADVVDWVLVSLRTDSVSTNTIFRVAGLLHSDGRITFVNPCFNIPSGQYFPVIEQRNHMGVMSPRRVPVVNNKLIFDFTTQNAYTVSDPPSFGEINIDNRWMMYGAEGKKDSFTDNFDINFFDSKLWKDESGIFDQYRYGDFNMDADVNFSDNVLWNKNNGRYSKVPH